MNDEFGRRSEKETERQSAGDENTVTNTENLSKNNKISPVPRHISNSQGLSQKLPCPNLQDSPKGRICISDNGVKLRDNIPLSPILPVHSPNKDSISGTPGHAGKENFDISWHREDDSYDGGVLRSTPTAHSPVIYHVMGNDDIRHQLLVQRTFNTHEDKPQILVSSHVTEIKSPTLGVLSVKTSSPKNDNAEGNSSPRQPKAQLSPFLTPYSDNASDFHSVFQTPVRGRQKRHEQGLESTPSFPQHPQTPSQTSLHSVTPLRYQHAMTPRRLQGALTPSSTGSPYVFTPGRNFFNPFEIDSGDLHLPVMSPGVFKIGNAQTEEGENKEPFWSMEHSALMMPVEIKESDVLKQHFYQQKRDKEKDVVVQSAINKFFSSEYILPSPWSEKAGSKLPRTPGSLISVSSQTTMSVPPDVDLLAELGGKFQLPEHKVEVEMSTEINSNSFIRRKLLNQLNENDSPLRGASPMLPSKSADSLRSTEMSSSTKHATPDLDNQTPRKKSSGHFSSSPIRESAVNKDYQPMSESELLASPELSPIAGRGRKSIRTADIFQSHQDLGSPREMMQLDFSSILDEPDELENEADKTGMLMLSKPASLQQQSEDNNSDLLDPNPLLISSSQALEDGSAGSSKLVSMMGKTLVNSGLSAESVGEINSTVPQSLTSQDTGYQTASMQSTVNQDFVSTSSSIHLSQETLAVCDPTRTLTDKDLGSHSSLTNQFTGMPFRSDAGHNSELDCFSFTSSENKSGLLSQPEPASQRQEVCRIRKVKTLSDMRRSKEKRSASRNLTQSFNEEDKVSSLSWSCERLNDSLSNSLCDMAEPLEVRYLKAQSKSEPFGFQKSVNVLRGKKTDCVIKETIPPKKENDSRNYSIPVNSSPYDKRSLDDSNIGGNFEAVRRVNETNESKFLKLVKTDHISVPSHEGTGKFSSEGTSTLVEARKLLGKSEALRKQLEDSGELQADTFLDQLISEGGQPEQDQDDRNMSHPLSPPDQQSKSTSQSSFLLSSLKKKINSVEGDKLGSEIAAEILRRAGEDLAQFK